MTSEHNPFTGNADYWWYRGKAKLLESFFGELVDPNAQVIDIGSADGPAVKFIDDRLALGSGVKLAMDIVPDGLRPEDILGSVEAIPVGDASFDLISAFDVIEHVENEALGLSEIYRVLKPGGRFFMSVPAYQWAWSRHDVELHHYRRYTVKRARAALEKAGFVIEKSSYGFFGTFPLFAIQRTIAKLKNSYSGEVPSVSKAQDKLLSSLVGLDAKVLTNGGKLPWGSSVFVAARKP